MEISFASRLKYPNRSESQLKDDYRTRVDIDRRVVDMEDQGMYTNPVAYYDFLQHRVMVHFKPKDEVSETSAGFDLTLSKKMTYDMVSIPSSRLCTTVGLTQCLE
jgi:ubiquitin carboxyl-terminal hydrolase 7